MNNENLGCLSGKDVTPQALPHNGITQLYHSKTSLQDYYEFPDNPELFEVFSEVRSNGIYSTEYEITKVRFIHPNRQKSIASEDKLVSLDYSKAAIDRIAMVSDLNSQFTGNEAALLADYLKIKFNYDCTIRKIDLPVTGMNIFDIASFASIECPEIQTISYSLDSDKTGLPFDVLAYYEVYCPLPFVFECSNHFQAGGVK